MADILGIVKLYEDGKHRRYSLLFAVNGGAFAIARLLKAPDGTDQLVLGSLHLWQLALGMALFTALMTADIDSFGRKMRVQGGDGAKLYRTVGVVILVSLGALIVAGWMLAAFDTTRAAVAVAAHVALWAAFRTAAGDAPRQPS